MKQGSMKVFLGALVLGMASAFSFVIISQAQTQSPNISFPVQELGNCNSQAECKTFCDNPKNMTACVNFAEKNNLMSKDDANKARKFESAGNKGPGGCTSQSTCETYCNNVSHINECLAFAEKTGLVSAKDLEEAKKVQAALLKGAKMPGGCTSKNECDAYCSNTDHLEECINFADTTGFLPESERIDAHKALEAVKKGAKMPPCKGKEQCDAYCSISSHMEVCINFAEAAGFISGEELVNAKKTLEAIRKGAVPPPCRGKEQCDVYCSEASHVEECIKFAEAAGFMSKDEAEMAKKTGGKGPGGCKSKEECTKFCDDPANQETCFNFGQQYGVIPEAEKQKMEAGVKSINDALNQAPAEVKACITNAIGAGKLEQIQAGKAIPAKDIGDKIKGCYESLMKSQFPQGMPQPNGGERGMPGGEQNPNMMNNIPPVMGGASQPQGRPMSFDQFTPAAISCIQSRIGASTFDGLKAGTVKPPADIAQIIETCVRGTMQMQQPQIPSGGMMPNFPQGQ